MSKRDLVIGAGVLLLLAVAIVRTAVPDRSRLRPLSIEGITIKSEPIGQGELKTTEQTWSPPVDVYVLGWSHFIGAHTPAAVLALVAPGDTVLLRALGGSEEIRPQFLAAGTGYRLRKGQQLRARLQLTNPGPPGETQGAVILIYFVPVEGN